MSAIPASGCYNKKDRQNIEFFGFFINSFMERPFIITRAIPEFNEVVIISFEKHSKFS